MKQIFIIFFVVCFIFVLPVALIQSLVGPVFTPIFGEEFTEIASWVIYGIILVFFAIRRVKRVREINQMVNALIVDYNDDAMGMFEAWFEDQEQYNNADLIPLKEATAYVISAYGGKEVLAKLIQEGHNQILFDDITSVLGNRGRRTYQDIATHASVTPMQKFLAGTAAFTIGYNFSRSRQR